MPFGITDPTSIVSTPLHYRVLRFYSSNSKLQAGSSSTMSYSSLEYA